jgi:hypothetical protein
MPATVDFEELPKIDFEETPAIAFEPIVPPIRTTPPRVPRPVPVTNPRPLAGRLADAVSGAIGDPSGMGMAGFAQTAKDFALNPLGTAAKTFAPGLDMSKPLVPVTVPEGTPLGEGIGDFVKNVVGGLSTPDTITTFAQAGLGPAAAEVVSAKFISQMAVDAPDQAADVGKKLAAGDKRGATTALLNYALDTVGAGAVAKGALGKPVPPPIQFEEIPDRPNNLIQLEGAPPGELPPEPEETAPAAPVANPEAKPAPAKENVTPEQEYDASKLTPAQKVKARDKFLKAQGVKPAEEPPVQSRMSAGPGAAAAGEPGTYSNIQQLSDKIKATAPQSATPADRISLIDRMKVSAESAKDSIKGAFAKAQAVKDALVSGYMTQPEWTDYKRIKGKWDYAVQKADFQSSNFLKQVRKEVPSKLRQEAITNWIQADGDEAVLRERASGAKAAFRQGYEAALKLTDREKELAGYIRDYFDRQLELGQNEGILKNGLEDYVTQVWKKENPVTTKLMSEISSSKLQPNFKFARKRVFDSFYEGEQAGFKPASKAIGDLLAHYDQTFNRSLAAREFLKNLRDNNASDGRPLAEVSGYGRPVEETDAQGKPISGTIDKYTVKPRALGDKLQGYRNIDHPALKGWKWAATTADGKPILFEGPLVVHPEIYQDLKNVLSKSSWRQMPVVREYLSAQREIKQTMLTFAGFHQVQETVHALGHLVNPLKTPEIDMEEPVTKALTEHGLQVFSFDAAKEFGEGVSSSGGLAKYIPVIGKSLHDYTQFLFQNIIPRLKISMARDALERNRKLYSKTLNEDQLLALTSREANAAFGEENLRSLGRNPNVQDAFNFFLFAPDFLISRGKFVGQALKPYGREQMMALGRIALTSYVAARLVNKWLDDDPHWELRNAFSVVYGKHRYSLRTVPGDILHMLTDPRSFWYNRISPGTRTVMELATGRDDRGVRRDALQQLNDAGQMLVPLGLRKRDDQNLLEAFANSFGIQTQRDTPEQQIHEKIDDWKRKTGVKQSAFEETYDQDKDVNRPLRLALEAGDLAKSKVAFDKLEKATPDREVRGKMESGKDQIRTAMEAHFTRPLTGSKANEAAFVKSLTPGERKEYEAAQASRQKQLKLFEEIAGKKLPAWAKPPPLRR